MMKKVIFGLGSLTIVGLAMVPVISCGSKKTVDILRNTKEDFAIELQSWYQNQYSSISKNELKHINILEHDESTWIKGKRNIESSFGIKLPNIPSHLHINAIGNEIDNWGSNASIDIVVSTRVINEEMDFDNVKDNDYYRRIKLKYITYENQGGIDFGKNVEKIKNINSITKSLLSGNDFQSLTDQQKINYNNLGLENLPVDYSVTVSNIHSHNSQSSKGTFVTFDAIIENHTYTSHKIPLYFITKDFKANYSAAVESIASHLSTTIEIDNLPNWELNQTIFPSDTYKHIDNMYEFNEQILPKLSKFSLYKRLGYGIEIRSSSVSSKTNGKTTLNFTLSSTKTNKKANTEWIFSNDYSKIKETINGLGEDFGDENIYFGTSENFSAITNKAEFEQNKSKFDNILLNKVGNVDLQYTFKENLTDRLHLEVSGSIGAKEYNWKKSIFILTKNDFDTKIALKGIENRIVTNDALPAITDESSFESNKAFFENLIQTNEQNVDLDYEWAESKNGAIKVKVTASKASIISQKFVWVVYKNQAEIDDFVTQILNENGSTLRSKKNSTSLEAELGTTINIDNLNEVLSISFKKPSDWKDVQVYGIEFSKVYDLMFEIKITFKKELFESSQTFNIKPKDFKN